MKFVKVVVDEIVSRLLMVVLSILVLLVGLYSPTRLMYAMHTYRYAKDKCSSC